MAGRAWCGELVGIWENQETKKGKKVEMGHQPQRPQHSDSLPPSMPYLLQAPQLPAENQMFKHMSLWRTFHSQVVTVTYSCECVHPCTQTCMTRVMLPSPGEQAPANSHLLLSLIHHKTRCSPCINVHMDLCSTAHFLSSRQSVNGACNSESSLQDSPRQFT